ncbi:GTP-binding protein [Methanoplanus sp. FWC-SCC4]|uniref:GTP-binding protein n=1 Tax=Methanochimaera problematica TaxID=2609417 RepID=A0AA97FBU9_9EURY|nr:GTPase [Methanoplanus sp. FWC-SCC4]WOF16550.1 GTP-binding protein [Methanoplanus sp. FWC-SCC4]
MEFENIPTIPTADEVLDRALRRSAMVRKEKRNKDRANEEFIRSIYSSVYDKLTDTVQKFPNFDELSPFYTDIVNLLFSVDKIRHSLGALKWAAEQTRSVGGSYARDMRRSEDTNAMRKQATARISSIVHQVDKDLRYLNDARNVLRKLPDIREEEFTVVVAGYPNVGKSSFMNIVSSATPQVAAYAFTTKKIIVGHREYGRFRFQLVDTPGILDRPYEKRNEIEHQALSAIRNVSDLILFIVDASEACGYSLEEQFRLYENLKELTNEVPVEVIINKSDMKEYPGYMNMSTVTRKGVREVLDMVTKYLESSPKYLLQNSPEGNQ